MESVITTKGRATIPKAIQEHLGLKAGDRVKFFVHPDGSVVLVPKRTATALRGIIKVSQRAVRIEKWMKQSPSARSQVRRVVYGGER